MKNQYLAKFLFLFLFLFSMASQAAIPVKLGLGIPLFYNSTGGGYAAGGAFSIGTGGANTNHFYFGVDADFIKAFDTSSLTAIAPYMNIGYNNVFIVDKMLYTIALIAGPAFILNWNAPGIFGNATPGPGITLLAGLKTELEYRVNLSWSLAFEFSATLLPWPILRPMAGVKYYL